MIRFQTETRERPRMSKQVHSKLLRDAHSEGGGTGASDWLARLVNPGLLTTYVIAGLGGAIAGSLGMPLAWLLGPFFLCGAVSAFGVKLVTLPFGREVSQVAIGLSVGLRFTPAILMAVITLVPAMLAAAVYVVLYTALASLLYRPLAGVTTTTAFFSTAAGGLADTAIVATRFGGDAASVGLVHSLRVSTTVAIVPLLVLAFSTPGTSIALAADTVPDLNSVALVVAATIVALLLARLLRFPNPWMVGPMLAGIAMGASGKVSLGIPEFVIILAQLLLGTWLGCQFRRETLARLPRVAISGAFVTLLMIGAAFAGALALSASTGLGLSTAFLAVAPAGMPEMVITSRVMNLDAGTVTAFHITRILVVCMTLSLVYHAYHYLSRVLHSLPVHKGDND